MVDHAPHGGERERVVAAVDHVHLPEPLDDEPAGGVGNAGILLTPVAAPNESTDFQ